ncbi:hypothetical protein SNEBB_001561 [Seison nebaliae]|nr:hypothetical protein SNEBB_001561 [Seison nebaliae]
MFRITSICFLVLYINLFELSLSKSTGKISVNTTFLHDTSTVKKDIEEANDLLPNKLDEEEIDNVLFKWDKTHKPKVDAINRSIDNEVASKRIILRNKSKKTVYSDDSSLIIDKENENGDNDNGKKRPLTSTIIISVSAVVIGGVIATIIFTLLRRRSDGKWGRIVTSKLDSSFDEETKNQTSEKSTTNGDIENDDENNKNLEDNVDDNGEEDEKTNLAGKVEETKTELNNTTDILDDDTQIYPKTKKRRYTLFNKFNFFRNHRLTESKDNEALLSLTRTEENEGETVVPPILSPKSEEDLLSNKDLLDQQNEMMEKGSNAAKASVSPIDGEDDNNSSIRENENIIESCELKESNEKNEDDNLSEDLLKEEEIEEKQSTKSDMIELTTNDDNGNDNDDIDDDNDNVKEEEEVNDEKLKE